MEILVKYNNLSLADSVTIQLMNDLNIYEIVSFDSDFDNKERIIKIYWLKLNFNWLYYMID